MKARHGCWGWMLEVEGSWGLEEGGSSTALHSRASVCRDVSLIFALALFYAHYEYSFQVDISINKLSSI